MKNCPYCKAQIEDNARFCLYCMKSLEEKRVILPKRQKNRWWLPVAAGGVVLLLLIAAVLIFGGERKAPASLQHETLSGTQTLPSDTGESLVPSSGPEQLPAGSQPPSGGDQEAPLPGSQQSQTAPNPGATATSQPDSQTALPPQATPVPQTPPAPAQPGQTPPPVSDPEQPEQTTPPSTTPTQPTVTTPPATEPAATTPPATQPVIAEPVYAYRAAREGDDFSANYANSGGDIVITGVTRRATDGTYDIPAYIDGKKVIAIVANAFSGSGATTVYVPATVKTIWNYAFSGCALKDIYFRGNAIYVESKAFSAGLTIHCAASCSDRNYRYYKNCAASYGATWKEWNG